MRTFASFLLLALATGCAGGRARLDFSGTQMPVSMSATVLDERGEILLPEDREVVGQVLVETKAWGIMWAAIPLTPKRDVSQAINDQVAAANGEAVVNLRVTGQQCGVNHAWILSTVPLWPGCSKIFVQGDIIRTRRSEPAAVAGSTMGVAP
jgi:hypothetical protein